MSKEEERGSTAWAEAMKSGIERGVRVGQMPVARWTAFFLSQVWLAVSKG